MSLLGSLTAFHEALIHTSKSHGLALEDLHILGTPEGAKYLDVLFLAMKADRQALPGPVTVAAKPIEMPYEATVDLPRLREMAGNLKANFGFNEVNPDITSERFPIVGDEVRPNVVFTFVHLNRNATIDEVLAEMERLGLRPATFAELLAFSLKYGDLQRQFPIVALGSSVRVSGYERFPVLRGYSLERRLFLRWDDSEWSGRCRFLAVRK